MKTTILALLLTLRVYGQQTDYIKVIELTDTVTVGDSITIKFTKTVNNGGNGMSRLQLWTSSYLQDCMYVFSGQMHYDSANVYKHKVKITSSMGVGNARIYSNATVGGYKSFYIKPLSQVGIAEYIKKLEVTSVKYYDIYGKEKPSILEGLTIKITTYSNGYQNKEKIIALQ